LPRTEPLVRAYYEENAANDLVLATGCSRDIRALSERIDSLAVEAFAPFLESRTEAERGRTDGLARRISRFIRMAV